MLILLYLPQLRGADMLSLLIGYDSYSLVGRIFRLHIVFGHTYIFHDRPSCIFLLWVRGDGSWVSPPF